MSVGADGVGSGAFGFGAEPDVVTSGNIKLSGPSNVSPDFTVTPSVGNTISYDPVYVYVAMFLLMLESSV